MSLGQIANPYAPLVGLTGIGLTGGLLYIGLDGQDPQTNPQQCYWDAAGTIPASQPIDVVGGYPMRLGTPAQVFTAGAYSMRLRDRAGVQVFYLASATGGSSGGASAAGYVSMAAAVAANVPTSSQATGLSLLGYYSPGDGGGGFYKYATVQAAGTGKFQSADGAWWELTEIDPAPQMFGAKADATNDDTAAIQAAIDFAIAKQLAGLGPRTVRLLGRYKITAPLRGFSYNGATFTACSFSIRGRARGYQSAKRTEIIPTFKNAPAIVLQKVRNVVIDDFAINGLANNGGTPTYAQLIGDTSSPWWNTGGATDSGYSPECGIAIDPFSNGLPTDGGYPGLNGTGGTNYYTDSSSGSSGVTIGEGMFITGHIVGVAVSLSPATQLGDNIRIGGNLSANKVCVAIGQSQNRGVLIERPFVLGCQTFIDCCRYGVGGTGPVPVVIGGVVDYVKWLLLSNTGGYGNGTFTGIYSESIFSLGVYTGTSPLDFYSCQFKFIGSSGGTGVADSILCNRGPVNFFGGQLIYYNNQPEALGFNNGPASGAGAKIAFIGCTLNNAPIVTDWGQLSADDCFLKYAGGTYGLSRNIYGTPSNAAASNARTVLTPGGQLVSGGGSTRQMWSELGGLFQAQMDAGVTVTNTGNGTATFTAASGAVYQAEMALCTLGSWTPWPELAATGVAVAATGGLLIGHVSGVVGNVVSLKNVPKNLPTGVYTIYLNRLGSLKQRTTGSTTSGSATVTSVSPTNTFGAGDYVHSTALSGIPLGTYVVSNSAGTMVLSQNATATRTAIDMQDAEYKLVDRGTVTPASGTRFVGDYRENTVPTTDANNMTLVGWICVLSGTPGTWKPVYQSAVSPAT